MNPFGQMSRLDLNQPPWRRRPDDRCALCGSQANWWVENPDRVLPAEDGEDESVTIKGMSGAACDQHRDEVCSRFQGIVGTTALATPIRWTWSQWRWVIKQRLDCRLRHHGWLNSLRTIPNEIRWWTSELRTRIALRRSLRRTKH